MATKYRIMLNPTSLISVEFGTSFHIGTAKSCAKHDPNNFFNPRSAVDQFLVAELKGVKGYCIIRLNSDLDWSYMSKEDEDYILKGNMKDKHAKMIIQYVKGRKFQRYLHITFSALRGSY